MGHRIESFTGKYLFLSNAYEAPFHWKGRLWLSVDHALYGSMVADEDNLDRVADAPTPGAAARLIQHMNICPEWEESRDGIMLSLLRAKFNAHADLADRLLATRKAQFIFTNRTGDTYWGVCGGEGENRLGILLMQIRTELANSDTQGNF